MEIENTLSYATSLGFAWRRMIWITAAFLMGSMAGTVGTFFVFITIDEGRGTDLLPLLLAWFGACALVASLIFLGGCAIIFWKSKRGPQRHGNWYALIGGILGFPLFLSLTYIPLIAAWADDDDWKTTAFNISFLILWPILCAVVLMRNRAGFTEEPAERLINH